MHAAANRTLSASRRLQGKHLKSMRPCDVAHSSPQINMAASLGRLAVVIVLALCVSLRIAAAVTVQEACQQHTKYPELCVKALSAVKPPDVAGPGLPELAEIAVALAEESNTAMVAFVKSLEARPGGMPPECLQQCVGQFQAAVAELKRSKVALDRFGENATGVKRWVEAAKADGDTCMRGCHKVEGGADPDIDGKIGDLGKLCSVALSLTDASVRNRTA